MVKKNVLFVIDSLNCAGAEKSIITLLSLLDYSRYDVDLQLFGYGGELEKLIPREVNLLDSLEYTKYSTLPVGKALLYSIKKYKFNMLYARLKYSLQIRKGRYSNAQKARLFWENISHLIESRDKEYDLAISYAQGIPTFYVADIIKAKKRYAWVNVSYKLIGVDREFQRKFYNCYNQVVAVSDSAKDIFLESYPEYKNKTRVIYDINDYNFIKRMAEYGESYENDFQGIRILTIGRLANQKGYDIAIEACRKLKEANINFKWYVLGKGPQKKEIERWIKDNNLEENFILLGVKSNPYPFIRDCDIYVQTSKFEGFGLAIAEARMLNKPVVTTRFDAVYNQMVHRKNGIVVDMSSQGIYDGILEIINNEKLRNSIIDYLKAEKKGNIEELVKFYDLIEGK
jgi:glycosyltransferase involved in cell wall biosynthesis